MFANAAGGADSMALFTHTLTRSQYQQLCRFACCTWQASAFSAQFRYIAHQHVAVARHCQNLKQRRSLNRHWRCRSSSSSNWFLPVLWGTDGPNSFQDLPAPLFDSIAAAPTDMWRAQRLPAHSRNIVTPRQRQQNIDATCSLQGKFRTVRGYIGYWWR